VAQVLRYRGSRGCGKVHDAKVHRTKVDIGIFIEHSAQNNTKSCKRGRPLALHFSYESSCMWQGRQPASVMRAFTQGVAKDQS
jgi:hypothetical protein